MEHLLSCLFERYLDEKTYIEARRPDTLLWYRSALRAASLPNIDAQLLDIATLKQAIVKMRSNGLAPRSVNTHLRALNVFLHWLHTNGYTTERLVAPLATRVGLPQVTTLSPAQITWLLAYRPRTLSERRAFALVVLMLDAGLRRDEARRLRREDVLLSDLELRIEGKGGKFRGVPISEAGRRILYQWLASHEHPLAFPTFNGTPMSKRNVTRDIAILLHRAGMEGVRCSPHTLRHTFATRYLANGGDPLRLQRILGHSTLTMTMRYVHLATEDLKADFGQRSAVAASGR